MTNFIFSRPMSTSKKLANSQTTILDNLRWLRSDISILDYKLSALIKASRLQSSVDEYYAKRDEDVPTDEPSPDVRDLD